MTKQTTRPGGPLSRGRSNLRTALRGSQKFSGVKDALTVDGFLKSIYPRDLTTYWTVVDPGGALTINPAAVGGKAALDAEFRLHGEAQDQIVQVYHDFEAEHEPLLTNHFRIRYEVTIDDDDDEVLMPVALLTNTFKEYNDLKADGDDYNYAMHGWDNDLVRWWHGHQAMSKFGSEGGTFGTSAGINKATKYYQEKWGKIWTGAGPSHTENDFQYRLYSNSDFTGQLIGAGHSDVQPGDPSVLQWRYLFLINNQADGTGTGKNKDITLKIVEILADHIDYTP